MSLSVYISGDAQAWRLAAALSPDIASTTSASRFSSLSLPLPLSPSTRPSLTHTASRRLDTVAQHDDAYALCGIGAGHHCKLSAHSTACCYTDSGHVDQLALPAQFLSRGVWPRNLSHQPVRTLWRCQDPPAVPGRRSGGLLRHAEPLAKRQTGERYLCLLGSQQ